jgi:hypothetical protein
VALSPYDSEKVALDAFAKAYPTAYQSIQVAAISLIFTRKAVIFRQSGNFSMRLCQLKIRQFLKVRPI